ncbi:MAG TPA: phage tail sheath subtilisin-like domain-containing protein [Burkholderiales bacterium]|nr:phage tail sheath subtilisin-like domain-containing protein [Burkholderiales bacterium]
MPEYLAPGVYVEETSFRAKSIEGVGTSTTAFVGPARKGPFRANSNDLTQPEMLTSYGDFERLYGTYSDFGYTGVRRTNYLAHAARAFFNEGGARLYVCRVVGSNATAATAAASAATGDEAIAFTARFPGSAGNGRIDITEISTPASDRVMENAPPGTFLRTGPADTPVHHVKMGSTWHPAANPAGAAAVTSELAGATPRVITLIVTTIDDMPPGEPRTGDRAQGNVLSYEDLGLHPSHPRYIGTVLKQTPDSRAEQLQNAYFISVGKDVAPSELQSALFTVDAKAVTTRTLLLDGGADGDPPGSAAYASALELLAGMEDISIVAAPGSAAYADAQAINGALIAHAEGRRAYRIAVLDTPPQQTPGQVRTLRGLMDSRYAALYYPWVVVSNPLFRPGREDIPREIALPPSGFVSGIYARNDIQRGVHKAPANEVVRSALRFEVDVNFGQQEGLNPIGVNCLRLLSGRGYRVWGARLISSDPEWKYVSDRRYFNYLEASIDRGTQWAVFEPNGERLWANVRQTIADFLYNEWRNGALLGASQEEAFFVRCDRSTMTQNDLDNGRLVCLIGVAIIRPAEFVIFRIGQKTADSRG